MRKYLTEFLGTFFIVLVIVLVANNQSVGMFAPLAIGAIFTVFIYASGHISGGNFNPSVSLAIFLRGKMSAVDLAFYIGSQLLGSIVGAACAVYLLGANEANLAAAEGDGTFSIPHGFVAEFLGAFALSFVVLNVATSRNTENNSYFGLAIGFTIMTCAYAFGGISGGAFNPAVALGITVANMKAWSMIWVFWAANFSGAAAAAFAFRFLSQE